VTLHERRRLVIANGSVAEGNSRLIFSTDPQKALDDFHAEERVSEEQIEAERLAERLRDQGWSEASIRDHGRDDEQHPLCGAVEAYYEGSLRPARVEYLNGESVATRPGLAAAQIRFPWWRGTISE